MAALEYQRYGRNKSTLVNKSYIESGEYKRKFENISDNKATNKALYNCAKTALKHRSGTNFEDMYWIDGYSGKIIAKEINSEYEQRIYYSLSTRKAILSNSHNNVVTLHTHPASMPPSVADFNSCYINGYQYGCIACHNGKVYVYISRQLISEELYNLYVIEYIDEGLDELEAQIKAIQALKRNHDIDFWEAS